MVTQRRIRGEIRGVDLRESATQIDSGGAVRKLLVAQGIEGDGAASGGPQQFFGFGVAEGEGAAPRNRDDRTGLAVGHRRAAGHRLAGLPRPAVHIRCRPRDPYEFGKVDVFRDPVGEPIELPGRLRALVGGYQAQVPGGSRDSVVAVQYAEHRDAGGLQRRDHLVRMTLGTGLVQDHSRDAGPAVVRRHAVHDRRDRPRCVRHVDDEDHRRGQQRRDV